jgi:NTP pyrophosphatase (non-canonical NTP hydrolase)
MMTFDEYQEQAKKTAIYKSVGGFSWIYPALELANESGEVLGKLKKTFRDEKDMRLSDERARAIHKEFGDTLWALSMLCTELGYSLSDVAQANLANLRGRQKRGTLNGDGDNR